MLLANISLEDFFRPLALFGFAGQFVFMLRFVVQWWASERSGRSYVPTAFWWISVTGALMLLIYATLREDVVIMLGQALPLAIYIRNIVMIQRRKARVRQRRTALESRPIPIPVAEQAR